MYTRPKKGRDSQKTAPSPHLQPNQLIKSNKDKVLDSKCTLLTHSKNMYMKERKIAWSKSSKALRFLSFQRVQNKHKGFALHAFFLFFPTKDPCQLRRTSLIERDIYPLDNKKSKDEVPQRGCLWTVGKDMVCSICWLLLTYAQITSSWKTPTPPF